MEPKIGLGITYSVGSDRHVGTIQKVSSDGKKFWFTDDKSTNIAVWPEQEWVHVSQPTSDENQMTSVGKISSGNKKGQWSIGGLSRGTPVKLGVRNKNVDPSF